MASVTNDVGCGMKIVVEASSNDPETERRVVRDEMYRHDCKVLETFLDKFNLPRIKSIRKDFKVGLQTHDPNFANPSWCHSSHALTAYPGGLLVVLHLLQGLLHHVGPDGGEESCCDLHQVGPHVLKDVLGEGGEVIIAGLTGLHSKHRVILGNVLPVVY